MIRDQCCSCPRFVEFMIYNFFDVYACDELLYKLKETIDSVLEENYSKYVNSGLKSIRFK